MILIFTTNRINLVLILLNSVPVVNILINCLTVHANINSYSLTDQRYNACDESLGT